MTTLSIRQKLVNYLQVADDKKVEAIYSILEEEIDANTIDWNDKQLIKELDKRSVEYRNGAVKAQSWDEVKEQILGSIQKQRG